MRKTCRRSACPSRSGSVENLRVLGEDDQGVIEHQVAYVDVPLSYMEEFYHLRLHLAMLQQHLMGLRGRIGPKETEVEA